MPSLSLSSSASFAPSSPGSLRSSAIQRRSSLKRLLAENTVWRKDQTIREAQRMTRAMNPADINRSFAIAGRGDCKQAGSEGARRR
jgi:hypothetical protein